MLQLKPLHLLQLPQYTVISHPPLPLNPSLPHFLNMCNDPKIESGHAVGLAAVGRIGGRPVLQPACNRVATLQAGHRIKKPDQKPTSNATIEAAVDASLVASPMPKSTKAMLKRGNDPNGLNSSTEKLVTPKSTSPVVRKESKKPRGGGQATVVSTDFSFLGRRAPGSVAAAQREQAALMRAQRKMRIAHYGRTAEKLETMAVVVSDVDAATVAGQEEKRCSFITPNSDPLYVAYHDEEWGVPVHDDKMLFELIVLTGAQVGLDWSSILKKRNEFRAAFGGFDAEALAGFSEKQIASISLEYGMDLGRVRGVIDNATRILEVRRHFGSLDKYLWGFVNHKPIATNYKSGRRIPVKTSKSESISKDLRRRGFRFVGPTVVHSFMQAAGLTNDHLISCPRHLHCSSLTTTTVH